MPDSIFLADRSRWSIVPDSRNFAQIQSPERAYYQGGRNGNIDVEAVNRFKLRRNFPKLKVPVWASKMKSVKKSKRKLPGIFTSDEDQVTDDRYAGIETFNLESFPQGYPRAAAWVDSDSDNRIFRKFGILHTRSLLYKQAELAILEAKLNNLDRKDAAGEDGWKLESYPILGDGEGDDRERAELMAEIYIKMKEYDDLLLRHHQLGTFRKPTKRLYRFLFNYFYNEHPTTEEDEKFIYKKDDLVCITDHAEFGWFDDLLNKLLDYPMFNTLFATEEDRNKTSNPFIHYYSRTRLGRVVSTLIAFLSTFLLLVPVYVLIMRPMSMQLMATVVLTFVLLFAVSVSVFTGARRHEVFAATAAYCAVLVVFLGNLFQTNQSSNGAGAGRGPKIG